MQICIYRKKYVNGSGNSERNVKNKNKNTTLRYIHLCHQKPNPTRETVPLPEIKSAKMQNGISFKGKKEHTICFFEKS
jgi:hypothetical protein